MSKKTNPLFYEKKPGFDRLGEKDESGLGPYCETYKAFLNAGKTERECVKWLTDKASALGFRPFARGMSLRPGDKIYQVNRAKGIILSVIGKQPLTEGLKITAAHLDAPRIDIRTIPLYEDDGIALFKTHYYGGIKKYQWAAMPLELHGVVCAVGEDGPETIEVNIGGKPEDPVLTVTDLLPHLAADQMKKSMGQGIPGENLNILAGSQPSENDKDCKDKVKLHILELLHEQYGVSEADFLSAELCVVPAYPARDVGIDRSMVGGYGQDDRACAFTAATALFDLKETPEKTAVCVLVDKEEIGSEGVTGMQSQFFDTFVRDICRTQDVYADECLEASVCLSADVTNAFDPTWPEVSDRRNDAKMNCGMALIKYTGARGKSGASDASAELMAQMRYLFDKNGVIWQTGQLGKVDQGGGGTVAMFMAKRNIDTVDAGVPVLSMHSPFEVVSKLDVYETYKGFCVFYQA